MRIATSSTLEDYRGKNGSADYWLSLLRLALHEANISSTLSLSARSCTPRSRVSSSALASSAR